MSTMDKLWAPWRVSYVRTIKSKQTHCIFCKASAGSGKEHLIFKTKHATGVLNIYPYNNGHMLISPHRHVKDLSKLSSDELVDLFSALETARQGLHKALKPDGFNIGINIGKAGGAGITGHVHIHIVPRWVGDTNFMPSLYSTKVISQSLDELHRHLRVVLKRMKNAGVTVY